MNVYCFPGLGANERIFEKVRLPEGYKKVCVSWKEPGKKESLESYAFRLVEEVDLSQDYILMGVSFGGMICTVLNDLLKPKKAILISSITGRNELPWYFRASGRMKLNSLLHMKTALKAAPFALDIMGARTPEEKEFLREMVNQASVNLVQWSIDKILNWENRKRPENVVQIHGNKDMVLPHTYTHVDHIIDNGNHFLIRNKADELNQIISTILKSE
ncbi:MAG: alpha/beta hydrolase [Bacteroidota bacterium]